MGRLVPVWSFSQRCFIRLKVDPEPQTRGYEGHPLAKTTPLSDSPPMHKTLSAKVEDLTSGLLPLDEFGAKELVNIHNYTRQPLPLVHASQSSSQVLALPDPYALSIITPWPTICLSRTNGGRVTVLQ